MVDSRRALTEPFSRAEEIQIRPYLERKVKLGMLHAIWQSKKLLLLRPLTALRLRNSGLVGKVATDL